MRRPTPCAIMEERCSSAGAGFAHALRSTVAVLGKRDSNRYTWSFSLIDELNPSLILSMYRGYAVADWPSTGFNPKWPRSRVMAPEVSDGPCGLHLQIGPGKSTACRWSAACTFYHSFILTSFVQYLDIAHGVCGLWGSLSLLSNLLEPGAYTRHAGRHQPPLYHLLEHSLGRDFHMMETKYAVP